ncbi:hypothetical protein [Streptomyces mangrovisoli]|uniref:Uncharacterized protein n=1 Tax=Streptomyces mangrovisoli TaxID=1428628 RepID=A0A1J4NPQ7_9ACTN|nr:hypothetical protein [Streptomyces mangrovisoli]OIJ63580.1 hypothetical protein WN71_032650 [Streptomyces mangrovisoli]
MGFSGHLVFARSDRPLRDAPVFAGIDEEQQDTVHAWPPRPGDWQTLQFDHERWEDDDLSALVGWTGAPACVADVSDSDVALVTGLGTDGRRWQAWLNLDHAAALLAEEPEDLDDVSLWVSTPEFAEAVRRKRAELEADVPADAEGALLWAADAGVPAAARQSRIEELLRSQETFVEDLFGALLDELGFPEAAEPAPEP